MKAIIHPVAGALALLTIATFWLSTVISELSGSHDLVVAVKSAIPWGLLVLIPALAATGGSGFALSQGVRSGAVGKKLKRMPFIAANGLLVLLPSALFLAARAKAGAFDAPFYAVQAVELIAGPINLFLLGLNMRDGFRMSGRLARSTLPLQPATLLRTETIAENTAAFHVSKPVGFTWQPGQAAVFSLLDEAGKTGIGMDHTFTLVGTAGSDDLIFATRMRDSRYKQALGRIAPGDRIGVQGPLGDFTLQDGSVRPRVFLAGGIGITPFLTMIRDAAKSHRLEKITLFYSNKDRAGAAFLAELDDLASANQEFTFVPTFTGTEATATQWPGETGRIDAAMLLRHVDIASKPVFYIAGPAAIVTGMEHILSGMGVDPTDIRYEAFFGY